MRKRDMYHLCTGNYTCRIKALALVLQPNPQASYPGAEDATCNP